MISFCAWELSNLSLGQFEISNFRSSPIVCFQVFCTVAIHRAIPQLTLKRIISVSSVILTLSIVYIRLAFHFDLYYKGVWALINEIAYYAMIASGYVVAISLVIAIFQLLKGKK